MSVVTVAFGEAVALALPLRRAGLRGGKAPTRMSTAPIDPGPSDTQRQDEKARLICLPAWLGWAVAACLALGTAYVAQLYLGTRAELAALRESEALARIEAENSRQLLEAERLLAQVQVSDLRTALEQVATLQRQAGLAQLKISSLASLLTDSPQAQAVAVWHPDAQEGILTVTNLPALPADRDYQLWVIDPQYPMPVDGGVFTVEPNSGEARLRFKPKEPIAGISRFAVSLERKGGVPKAEGPMVLISP